MEFWQHVAFLETDQLFDVVRRAEEVGFTGIVTADHQIYPKRLASKYPYTPDGSPLWSPAEPADRRPPDPLGLVDLNELSGGMEENAA